MCHGMRAVWLALLLKLVNGYPPLFEQMKCQYGERGSLTAICTNATPGFFKNTPYKFDHLDETLKCVNCTLTELLQGTFDFSGNEIKVLDLDDSNIQVIDVKAFMGLIFLEKLILSHNRIFTIRYGAFAGVRKIQYINMEDALIPSSSLDNDVFAGLVNLQVLILKSNGLISLKERCFNGLTNLKNLDLSENKLQTIDHRLMYLPNLQEIYLANNNIQVLEGSEFYGLDKLFLIDLSNNLVGNITIDLSPKNVLKELDLTNNHMGNENVKIGTFKHMTHLEILNLDLNWFKTIPPKFFEGLYDLHTLSLYNNQIDKFELGSFSGLPSLRNLNMSHNKISGLKLKSKLSMHELHTLDLSHNLISHLAYFDMVLNMPKLTFINLKNNSLPCDIKNELAVYFPHDNIFFELDSVDQNICHKGESRSDAELLQSLNVQILHESESNTRSAKVAIFTLLSIIVVLVGLLFYISVFILRKRYLGGVP